MSRQVRVGGKAFFSQSLVFLTLLVVWKTSMHESHFVLEPLSITRTWALYTPPLEGLHLGVVTILTLRFSFSFHQLYSLFNFFSEGRQRLDMVVSPRRKNTTYSTPSLYGFHGYLHFKRFHGSYLVRQAIIVFLKPPCMLTWQMEYFFTLLPRLEAKF